MNSEKMEQLIALLSGLKKYEWSRIAVAVEKIYTSKSNRIELDSEALKKQLELEFLI